VDKRFPVMVPGEPEQKSRQECLESGIPLDQNTVEGIIQAAMQMGIPEADARSLVSEQA
jgi:LDH2 family malate/lactate/ureidoglycolate dehydrogenase